MAKKGLPNKIAVGGNLCTAISINNVMYTWGENQREPVQLGDGRYPKHTGCSANKDTIVGYYNAWQDSAAPIYVYEGANNYGVPKSNAGQIELGDNYYAYITEKSGFTTTQLLRSYGQLETEINLGLFRHYDSYHYSDYVCSNDFIACTTDNKTFHILGSFTYYNSEVLIGKGETTKGIKVVAGESFILVLNNDKTIKTYSTIDSYDVIEQRTPIENHFIAVAATKDTAFALKEDGTIIGWGFNEKLLNDTPTNRGYVQIHAGHAANSMIAIHKNGSLHVWGDDTYGQVSNAPKERVFWEVVPASSLLKTNTNQIITLENGKWVTKDEANFVDSFNPNVVTDRQWNELFNLPYTNFSLLTEKETDSNISLEQFKKEIESSMSREILYQDGLNKISKIIIGKEE